MGLQRNGLLWEVFQVLPVLPNKINAMLSKVFFLSCLLAVTLAAPAADPEADPLADADPAADADAYYGYGYCHVVPVAYHVPNCTVEEKVVTVKQCTPKVEKKCEDVVYKSIKVTYVDECKDLVTKHRSDGTVETNEVEAGAGVEEERKKREADPEAAADADAYYGSGYGHGYYGYGAYHHPITQAVVTVKHHCVETPHKACITKPVTEEVENTVPHCVLEHSADCEDVEHKVPHTVCV